MDFFNSPWLISMLEKSSHTPSGRLLGLFDILNDWLHAPHVQKNPDLGNAPHSLLIHYCTEQARAIDAENPDILAEHIVLIARNAALQTLQAQHASKTPNNSLEHAKKAASALIMAQTQKPAHISKLKPFKPALYGIAASFLIVLSVATLWLTELTQDSKAQLALTEVPVVSPSETPNQAAGISAHDAAMMYAKYEQMRQGTCHFPEALLIPDKHKAIYLDNVVGGKLPATLDDLTIANSYLEKVRCNFTPMLMAASK